MSGVEVVGLLLGAIPLVLPALDAYKDGLSRASVFVRRRRHVEELIRALGVNRLLLDQNVRLLLTKVGVEDIPSNSLDLFRLLDEDKQINEDVKGFLGIEAHRLYMDTVGICEGVIRDLVKSVEGLLPKQIGLQDDLISLLEANSNVAHGRLDLKQRFKLTIGRTELNNIVIELDKTVQDLERLQRAMDATREAEKGSYARKASRMAAMIEATRNHVLLLCSSVSRAMMKCQTHGHDHPAQLYLNGCTELIINKKLTSTRLAKGQKNFQLRIACASTGPGLRWYDANIELTSDGSRPTSPVTRRIPDAARVRFPIVNRPQGALASLEDIDNLCQKLQSWGITQVPLQLHISGAGNIARCEQSIASATSITTHTTITLEKSLAARTGAAMGLKPRMILALNLAISLLHLYQTPWLQTNWSKAAIEFLQDTPLPGNAPSAVIQVRYDQPLLSHKFGPPTLPTPNRSDPRPQQALLELAIMLLELWHDTAIEIYTPSIPHEHWARLQAASAWMDDPHNEPLPLYGAAVRHCLKTSIFDTSWDDAEFRRDYCENIIEPLRRSCEDWLRTGNLSTTVNKYPPWPLSLRSLWQIGYSRNQSSKPAPGHHLGQSLSKNLTHYIVAYLAFCAPLRFAEASPALDYGRRNLKLLAKTFTRRANPDALSVSPDPDLSNAGQCTYTYANMMTPGSEKGQLYAPLGAEIDSALGSGAVHDSSPGAAIVGLVLAALWQPQVTAGIDDTSGQTVVMVDLDGPSGTILVSAPTILSSHLPAVEARLCKRTLPETSEDVLPALKNAVGSMPCVSTTIELIDFPSFGDQYNDDTQDITIDIGVLGPAVGWADTINFTFPDGTWFFLTGRYTAVGFNECSVTLYNPGVSNPTTPGQEDDGADVVLPDSLLPWITAQVSTFERDPGDDTVARSLQLHRRAPPKLQPDPAMLSVVHQSTCSYAYAPADQLGTTVFNIRALKGRNVQQGFVGDCTVGAAALELLATHRFKPQLAGSTTTSDVVIDANLFVDEQGHSVVIRSSNRLPAAADFSPSSGCFQYMGYQDSGALYIPFLEKSMALLLDANPSMRSSTQPLAGYNGLNDVPQDFALRTMTGIPIAVIDRGATIGTYPALKTAALNARSAGKPTYFGTMGDQELIACTLTLPSGVMRLLDISHALSGTFWSVEPTCHPAALIVGDHAYATKSLGNNVMLTIANPWGLLTPLTAGWDQSGASQLDQLQRHDDSGITQYCNLDRHLSQASRAVKEMTMFTVLYL